MALPYSIPTIIEIADICQYLAEVDNLKKRSFRNGALVNHLPQLLYMENSTLRWLYETDPTNVSLDSVGKYVFALCSGYVARAVDIMTGGQGGSVAVISSGSIPSPYYFIVDASTSFMVDGDTTKIITSFIGFNLVYSRNGIVQTTVTSEPTYFSWNSVTGVFVTTPALVTSELIALVPT